VKIYENRIWITFLFFLLLSLGEVMVLDLFKQLERDGQLAHLPGNTKEDKMKMLRQLLEILRMSESAAVIKVQ